MAEPKTKPTAASVTKFLNAVPDKTRREDSFAVVEMMREITKEEPAMWGGSIVGFGLHHYKYESGREGDWPIAAFSPRKGDLTVYLPPGFDKAPEMEKLGKCKTSKSCLHIKKLADVDARVLRKLIAKYVKEAKSGRVKF